MTRSGDFGPGRAVVSEVGPSEPFPLADPADLVAAVGVLCLAMLRQDSVTVAVEQPSAAPRRFIVAPGAAPRPAPSGVPPHVGILLTGDPPDGQPALRYPITVVCHRDGRGGARVRTLVDTAVMDGGLGAVLAAQLPRRMAAGAPDDPRYPFVLEAAEVAEILAAGAGPRLPEPPAGTLHESVVAVAAGQPDRIAVVDDATELTYAELDRLSRAAARALVELGVLPGDRVGVCMRRSVPAVLALLAVLRAGACYVPLDPGHPSERLAYVVQDASLRVVITDGDALDDRPDVHRVRIEDLTAHPGVGELPRVDPGSPAYVIYTSGTTGQPKGAAVPHRNVLALIEATRHEFGIGPSDVWTVFHSLAFDVSVWEIWGGLLTGGTLVMVGHWTARTPAEFAQLLRGHRVTVLSQTPSAFAIVAPAVLAEPEPVAVRLIVFAGETLRMPMLADWLSRYPTAGCRLVNMYGITETTVHVTWHDVTAADVATNSRSVGRALPGWSMSVRAPDGRPLPFHLPGEVYVGGAGLAIGYHNRPELTAQRFPVDPVTGARCYRSGDLGRLRPDGTLDHLGRIDDQVKIRGHRVEIGEVRAALLDDGDVRDAAVTFRDEQGGRLLAYVVAAEAVAAADIRRRLAGRLPDYMVPAGVHTVASLPLTTNGKVDFAALAAAVPDATPAAAVPDAAPARAATDPAEVVARVWQDTFGAGRTEENFFDLGGNSLTALQISNALADLGYPVVDPRDVYLNPTVDGLVAHIRST